MRFPRSSIFPSQSPLFWVEQKDRYLRQLLIRDIEDCTNRRLVVAFGNRFVRGSDIQPRDIAYVNEILGDCVGQSVDLLLETNGGETDAAEAIVSLLRGIVADYRVVVANAAKSNGTLIALSATSICMGVTSELGPIEPSVGGVPASTLMRDEVKSQNFGLHVAGIQALRNSDLLAQKFLREGMMKSSTEQEIQKTAKLLSTRDAYPSHGSVIDRGEAERLNLHVTRLEIGDPIWDRIWLLYCMYDYDARKAEVAKIFEGRYRSLSIGAIKV